MCIAEKLLAIKTRRCSKFRPLTNFLLPTKDIKLCLNHQANSEPFKSTLITTENEIL